MPMPATRIPEGAVTGEAIRHSPNISRNAATKSTEPMTNCERVMSMGVPQVFFDDTGFRPAGFACLPCFDRVA